ncbi:MAG: HYR domain-containing protein, partial [Bacteroidota bacterium]
MQALRFLFLVLSILSFGVLQANSDPDEGSDEGLILISSVELISPSSCGAGDGLIKINAFGNPGPFQYSIDGGDSFFTNEGTFTDVQAGTYEIRVRGSNGCCMISTFPQTIECVSANAAPEFQFVNINNGWTNDEENFWTCAGQTVNIAIQVIDADFDDLVLGSPDPQVEELIGAGNFQISTFGNNFTTGQLNLTVSITPPNDFFGPLPFTLSVTDNPGDDPVFTTKEYVLEVANLSTTIDSEKACAGVANTFEIATMTYPEGATIDWEVVSGHTVDFIFDGNNTIAMTDEATEVGQFLQLRGILQVGDGNYSCTIKRNVSVEMGAFPISVGIDASAASLCGEDAIGFTANVNGYGAIASQSQFVWTSTGPAIPTSGDQFSSNFQGTQTETVTVQAIYGACSGSATKEITVDCPEIEIAAIISSASCEENNGGITLGIDGGLAPYIINWSTGVQGQTALSALFPGTYQVSVEDVLGNEVVSTFEVEVDNDEIAPVLACPQGLSSISLDSNCEALMPDLRLLLEVSDNCIGEITLSQFPAPGSFLPYGTTQQTVKFKAADGAGNVSTCEITLPVEDNTAPTVICGIENVVQINDICEVMIPDMRPQTLAFDNCDDQLLVEQFPAPGTMVAEGFDELIVEVSVMDVYGNYSTCIYQLIVEDVKAPEVLFCQESVVKVNDQGKCGAIIGFQDPVVDDCSPVVIEQIMGLPSGELFPVGLTNVLFKISDSFGNTAFCGFNVQVADFEAPQILVSSENVSVFLDETGKVNLTEDNLGVAAQDNCSLDKFEMTPNVFYCNDLGMQNVRLTAVDQFGNLTEVDLMVEVKDNVSPSMFCSQEVQELNALEAENINVSMLDVSAEDNCGLDDLTITSGPL